MKINFIDLKKQYNTYKSEIDSAIKEVIDSTQYINGSYVKKLEEKLQEYIGVKHAIVCASGTDALQLALMAYDVGPGDEIVTTPFTFIATAEVIRLLGATPVFVDIQEESYRVTAFHTTDEHTYRIVINSF